MFQLLVTPEFQHSIINMTALKNAIADGGTPVLPKQKHSLAITFSIAFGRHLGV